jgi:glucose/arabinose dehydrogenase
MVKPMILYMKKFISVAVLAGLFSATHFSAQVMESDYYQIETFPVPQGIAMEVSGMALLPDGRLMVATRVGDVFIVENACGDPANVEFKRWTLGLAQPLGLLAHDGWIYTAQRGELTRMKDSTGDGRADVFETVSDQWEISGNYHEYNFGPRVDKDGYLWVTTNKPFGNEPYGFAHWRGWALRIHPETGEMIPMAAGLRSPAGVEVAPWGDVFYTDNQGEWCNASKLAHISFGEFHGHPHGLPSSELAGAPFNTIPAPVSGTFMKDMHRQIPNFKMPAVWFPYDKMGKSPSGFKWDLSEGKFGSFAGQLFVGDQHHSSIMRVDLEEVDGHWQGACFPFREGFQSGIIRLCFGADDSLFVGMSNAGWGSRGNSPWGLQRVRWTGKTPFAIKTMRAKKDGFELTFTLPVDKKAASDPANYQMESYTYRLESRYGGPEEDKRNVQIESAMVSADGTKVRLTVSPLRAGYVHELLISRITAEDGTPLLHSAAYYTLVNIPGSETVQISR